jgi:hypothetical protein
MNRRSLAVSLLLVAAMALPLSASQFIELPFDQVARNATLVVRGTVTGPVTSAWNDSHDVIFSYATVRVNRFVAGDGPELLVVREVGGTVDGYTQEAIGFPMLREGENVVLFLTHWDDSTDWRIDSYNQGKYLVTKTPQGEFLMHDPVTQGHERLGGHEPMRIEALDGAGLSMNELEQMVTAARGNRAGVQQRN